MTAGLQDDSRIEAVANALLQSGTAASSPSSYFQNVTTGGDLLTKLTSEPLNVSYEEAMQRLTGSVIGPDGRQTCLVVNLTDKAVANFRAALGRGTRGPFGIGRERGVLFDLLLAGIPRCTFLE